MQIRTTVLAVLVSLAATRAAQAQYEWDKADEIGIQYRVHKKLKRLPLKLGSGDESLVARYEPIENGDMIHGRFGAAPWGLRVVRFAKQSAEPVITGPKTTADGNKTDKAGKAKAGTTVSGRPEKDKVARNFNDWVKGAGKGPAQRYVVQAKEFKKNRAQGEKLPYEWWEYTTRQKASNGYESFEYTIYYYAAVYDLEDDIVSLVCEIPLQKGDRPKGKHVQWAKTMLQSVSLLKNTRDDDEMIGSAKKDTFADTPAKQKALDAAKANIADMLGKSWDYYTTPNYIVLYSWEAGKTSMMRKQYKIARDLTDDLEEVRKMYVELYPPHEKMGNPYSVLRILYDKSQFDRYGGTGGGVVGWFSPSSKELVVFTGDTLMPGLTKAVTFHEGWHQYCDSYFGTELHRWFDEGTGDYFGSFVKKGRNWKYEPSKMRSQTLRRLLNDDSWIPFSEIVTWNKDKFYGRRASDYYAQGYAMVDFLRRGPDELRSRWDPAWSGILETYRDTALKTKEQKKAVEAAFKEIDWDKMQKMWVAWVKKELL